jgi:hypothetical protein
MSLESRYTITVNRNSPAISQVGFGTPLVFGYVDTAIIPGSQRTRQYAAATALSQMVTDGFAVTDPVYLAVEAVLSQTPRPTVVKVGRGALDFTHAIELTPTAFASGETITVSITKGTTTRAYSQSCGGVSINAEATALATLLNADASGWGSSGSGELTIADGTGKVTIDAVSPANDNEQWYYSVMTNLDLEDVQTDRGMSTDLTAIEAYDSDWYCLLLADAFGDIEITAAATWTETRQKICLAACQDSQIKAGTGVGHDLAAAARDRTSIWFSDNSMNEYLACGEAGRFLPKAPGEIVWCDKTISGATASSLTAAQISAMETDNVNHYTTVSGVGNAFPGTVASGEYIDIIRLTDWTVARVREGIFSAARASDKIPFDDSGVATIKGVVLGVIRSKIPKGFVEDSESFSAPSVADVSAANKALRTLPDVTFGATFAGAILYVTMEANLNF